MARENKTKYALLGVLNHQPGSGYDIKKFCDQSIGFFWNENYGHIYPVLKKLEEDQLIIKHTEENEGHPQKNIYSVTQKGKDELDHWLTLPVDAVPQRSELLLKLFFSTNVPCKDIIKRIEEIRFNYTEVIKKLQAQEKLLNSPDYKKDNSEKDIALWIITVKCGINSLKAEINWCDESIEILKSLDSEN